MYKELNLRTQRVEDPIFFFPIHIMKINVKLLTSFLVGSMMFNVILLISYAPVHNVNISLNSLTQDSIPPANSLEQEFIVGSPRTLNDNAVNSMTMCHR